MSLQSQLKIVFAGVVGSGKTTSIRAISDIDPFETEEFATDATRYFKEKTTVAMDYGRIDLEGDTSVHLYGAPGQERFEFMWDILAQGALGVIILVKNSSSAPLAHLDRYIKAFSPHLDKNGIVVGVTFTDVSQSTDISEYRNLLKSYNRTIPLYTLDARNPEMVRILVKTLLYRIDPMLNTTH